jgi:hypothetical protein
MPKEQKSCYFNSYLANWHEICCATNLVYFYILSKNDTTNKQKLHWQSQDQMLKFTSRMNLVL